MEQLYNSSLVLALVLIADWAALLYLMRITNRRVE